MFARQSQLFAGGPAEGFLQKFSAVARLAGLVALVVAASIIGNPVILAALFVAVLVLAVVSYLDVPSILRLVVLPLAIFALPSWLVAVVFFDAPAAAAGLGCLRVAACVGVAAVFLHSIGLINIGPALRRMGLPAELCLAWQMMISQAATFSELSDEMQLARQARLMTNPGGGVVRRLIGGQAAILLARMLQRSEELAMATQARRIDGLGNSVSLEMRSGHAMEELPLFRMQNVTHEFSPGAIALDDVCAAVESGGCTLLLGANGAGKSTLLHLLAGLLTATHGQIRWRENEISAAAFESSPELRREFRRRAGIVFQDPDCQWLCETVQQEVEFGPRQIWPCEEAVERAAQVMVMLGINHLADRPPYMLSGGQKRRVALASVIAMDPDVLLLDEPTLSLDAATTDFLLDWLGEYLHDPAKTLIIATHDLALARELGQKAIVLTPCHKLARVGAASDILRDSAFLRQMNLMSRRGGQVQAPAPFLVD